MQKQDTKALFEGDEKEETNVKHIKKVKPVAQAQTGTGNTKTAGPVKLPVPCIPIDGGDD